MNELDLTKPHIRAMDAISEAIQHYQARDQHGDDLNAAEKQFLAALWHCYDLLARTEIVKAVEHPMPAEMWEPGDSEMVNRYGATENHLLDMLLSAINQDGRYPVNLREVLLLSMRNENVTQRKLAELLDIRYQTISDYLNGKTPWSADKFEAAINELIHKK